MRYFCKGTNTIKGYDNRAKKNRIDGNANKS